MAITLVTGLPGHGKTLWTLARLKPLAEAENRPVFHSSGKPVEGSFGIPGLAIDGWQQHNPLQWFDLPPNSYMVVDECQRVFPIRARSSAVPKHVEELETHRHGGLDLFLITQHPMLVDTNVRKLVDRHFHVVRTFGMKRATVYEFPSGVQDSPEKNKAKNGVVRHEWAYPKKAFAWYKSAEVHTVRRRVPARVFLTLGALLLVPLLLWFCYTRLWVQHGFGDKAPVGAGAASGGAAGRVAHARAAGGGAPGQADVLTEADYLARFRPRIAGLSFSAPIYDELTKPVEAPYPSVCAYSPEFPCRCWSQRGFSLIVPKALCEQLAKEPIDPYWLRRGPHGLERPGDSAAAPTGADGQSVVPVGADRPVVVPVQAAS